GTHEPYQARACLAGLEAGELAHQDGGDGEDHDDLDGDGEAANERAQGTMDEIANNQFVHTGISVWERERKPDRTKGSEEKGRFRIGRKRGGAAGWECA